MPRHTLIHIIGSNSRGGAEVYALDICRWFRLKGWKVRVVTRDARDVDTAYSKYGISIRHAPLRDYPDLFSTLMILPMVRHMPQGGGIIHCHRLRDCLTAIAARRIARRPDIRIMVTRHLTARGSKSPLARFIYRQVDHILFVSDFAKRRFLGAWPDGRYPFDINKLEVTFNSLLPIDFEERLATLPPPHTMGEMRSHNLFALTEPATTPDRGPVTAMYLGRIKPGKGLETLIDAMALLEKDVKCRVRIVGRGAPDYYDALRRRAEMRGVMHLIDWIRDDSSAQQLIHRSHFGVFPSIDTEAFGMANLMFMAAGRAQISTLTGGQKEFLTDGVDALEVRPASAAHLAAVITRLTLDTELRQRLSEAALQKFRDTLSWPHFLARLPY